MPHLKHPLRLAVAAVLIVGAGLVVLWPDGDDTMVNPADVRLQVGMSRAAVEAVRGLPVMSQRLAEAAPQLHGHEAEREWWRW